MTERIIQRELRRLFANYDYKLFNTFIFNWESDFFAISTSSYSVEVEIKISKSDFKKDFTHKVAKHHLLSNHKKTAVVSERRPFKVYVRPPAIFNPDTFQYRNGDASYVDFCTPSNHIPNKFYYACPEGLIKMEDLPPYAGLIYIETYTNQFGRGYHTKEIKKAPFLHKNVNKHTSSLLSKYYHKHINDRNEVIQLLHVLDKDNLTPYQRAVIRTLKYKLY